MRLIRGFTKILGHIHYTRNKGFFSLLCLILKLSSSYVDDLAMFEPSSASSSLVQEKRCCREQRAMLIHGGGQATYVQNNPNGSNTIFRVRFLIHISPNNNILDFVCHAFLSPKCSVQRNRDD